jgi:threonine synthase
MSALQALICPQCQRSFAADQVQRFCQDCHSPLWARYDLQAVKGRVDPRGLQGAGGGLWRWRELLPVRNPAYQISLGEGDTPLIPLLNLARDLGLRRLWLKDESRNPTGSFKDRGMAVALSRARELGLRRWVMASAGNAGGALAMYAARAGGRARVYMPADAPEVNKREVRAAGAEIILVDGMIDLAGQRAAQDAEEGGWFNVSTFREPYRLEGKKTLGFEIARDLNWRLPGVIIYPTGGGTGLVGMWKAFHELRSLDWLAEQSLPRMVVVQAAGCAPVVQAIQAGWEEVEPWPQAQTRASGLRVPWTLAHRLILGAVRESGGTGVAVTEEEIAQAQADMARREGVLACPEGAATLAGLRRLLHQGWVDPQEDVVIFNTATGLKYL